MSTSARCDHAARSGPTDLSSIDRERKVRYKPRANDPRRASLPAGTARHCRSTAPSTRRFPLHLNRTTTRALAASVAMVAAGGTVAGAAVFHIPVLGFGAVNAGAKTQVV